MIELAGDFGGVGPKHHAAAAEQHHYHILSPLVHTIGNKPAEARAIFAARSRLSENLHLGVVGQPRGAVKNRGREPLTDLRQIGRKAREPPPHDGLELRDLLGRARVLKFVKRAAIRKRSRKRGKLPWDTVSAEYILEYGVDALEMHADALADGARLVNDVSGGLAAPARAGPLNARAHRRLPRWLLAVGPGWRVVRADTDAGSITTVGQSGARWGYRLLLVELLLIPVLYLVMIRPQQKRQKQWQAMLAAIKTESPGFSSTTKVPACRWSSWWFIPRSVSAARSNARYHW